MAKQRQLIIQLIDVVCKEEKVDHITFSITQNHVLDKGTKFTGKKHKYTVLGSTTDENSRVPLYSAKLTPAIKVTEQSKGEPDQEYFERRFKDVQFDLNSGALI